MRFRAKITDFLKEQLLQMSQMDLSKFQAKEMDKKSILIFVLLLLGFSHCRHRNRSKSSKAIINVNKNRMTGFITATSLS